MENKKTGDLGEKYAQRVLLEKGFKIVGENYHSRYGEIDIIAQNSEFVLFVEVKTRSENSLGSPAQAVTKQKQKKILRTAVEYINKTNCELQPRFDVIEIITQKGAEFKVKEHNHIENAFWAEDIYAIF